MKKARPLTALGILAGVIFLVFTALSVVAYFKILNIKDPLLANLKSHIDGDLQIGSARAMIFPAGINLEDVRLYAPGDKVPAVVIKSAELRFKLFPLIQKKIETNLIVMDPVVELKVPERGPSNMELVFAPLMAGKTKGETTALDRLWWKRLAVNQLTIENAHFKVTEAGSPQATELKNLNIQAKDIRFESGRKPAEIYIKYDLPNLSKEPLELKTRLRFMEQNQSLAVEDGKFLWGPIRVDLGGQALLPTEKRKDVELDLKFQAKEISLQDLAKVLKSGPSLKGHMSLQGSVTGSPFAPQVMMSLDSPSLTAKGLSLSRLHAELIKKGKPLSLTNTSFEVYGGKVHTSGELFPGPQTQADLQIKLSSLSLAAMSGKKDLPARLSGDLKVKSKDLENLDSYHGGGVVTVGPVPLPAVDLKSKIKIAEVLSAGTELGNMVNVGMLGNSAHVIGTQIDTIKATVGIGGGNITLQPFSMGNGHFSASGNGTIIRQKNVSGSGIFTLNQRVTRQLILDPLLRRTLTDGRDQLSFPFSFQGPLSDPNVTVDSSALRGKMARAMVLVLQKQALGQLDAQKILDSSLKGTPLGDPKNPLGRILGTTTHSGKTAPQTTSRTPPSQKSPAQTKKPQSTTGNPLADQLLFGR